MWPRHVLIWWWTLVLYHLTSSYRQLWPVLTTVHHCARGIHTGVWNRAQHAPRFKDHRKWYPILKAAPDTLWLARGFRWFLLSNRPQIMMQCWDAAKAAECKFCITMWGNINSHRQFEKVFDNLQDWVPLTNQHVMKRVPNGSQDKTVVKAPVSLQM